MLTQGGASTCDILSDSTHLICGIGQGHKDFDILEAAVIYNVLPVTQEWVFQSVAIGRLAPTQQYVPRLNDDHVVDEKGDQNDNLMQAEPCQINHKEMAKNELSVKV